MLKNLLQASSVFESSKFLILINKISCYLYITIKRSPYRKLKAVTTFQDVSLFIIFMTIGIISMAYSFTMETNIDKSKSVVSEMAIYFKLRMQFFQTMIGVLMAFVNRRNAFDIVKRMTLIDSEVCTKF